MGFLSRRNRSTSGLTGLAVARVVLAFVFCTYLCTAAHSLTLQQRKAVLERRTRLARSQFDRLLGLYRVDTPSWKLRKQRLFKEYKKIKSILPTCYGQYGGMIALINKRIQTINQHERDHSFKKKLSALRAAATAKRLEMLAAKAKERAAKAKERVAEAKERLELAAKKRKERADRFAKRRREGKARRIRAAAHAKHLRNKWTSRRTSATPRRSTSPRSSGYTQSPFSSGN